MATFSQGFLSSLGRPAMAQSLFGLGQTIGGLPRQAQDRRKQQQFNQLMQQGQAAMASGDATQLAQIGQQLTSAGYAREGQALTQASVAAKEKQRTQAEAVGQQRTSAQMLMTELQDYANNPQLPQPVRQQASNLLRAAAQVGDRATLLEPRVAQLRNLAFQAGKPQVVSPGGALVSPTGEELYRAPFKPAEPKAPAIRS